MRLPTSDTRKAFTSRRTCAWCAETYSSATTMSFSGWRPMRGDRLGQPVRLPPATVSVSSGTSCFGRTPRLCTLDHHAAPAELAVRRDGGLDGRDGLGTARPDLRVVLVEPRGQVEPRVEQPARDVRHVEPQPDQPLELQRPRPHALEAVPEHQRADQLAVAEDELAVPDLAPGSGEVRDDLVALALDRPSDGAEVEVPQARCVVLHADRSTGGRRRSC